MDKKKAGGQGMTADKKIYDAKLDPNFQDPYIDEEEWREREISGGKKARYLYVHGGFRNKGVKFILC